MGGNYLHYPGSDGGRAYYLNAWALARVPPSTVAVYVYLQPLIAFALAPLLLDETLSWRAVIASGLILPACLL